MVRGVQSAALTDLVLARVAELSQHGVQRGGRRGELRVQRGWGAEAHLAGAGAGAGAGAH